MGRGGAQVAERIQMNFNARLIGPRAVSQRAKRGAERRGNADIHNGSRKKPFHEESY